MTSDDLLQVILQFCPSATIEEDLYGQVVVYTGVREIADGTLVPLNDGRE